jgi:hypothetical protein
MELETILERIRELKQQQILLGIKIEVWKEEIKSKTELWNLSLNIEVKR